ncbi:aldo/keto reductase [Nostoc sp.]|uniref:aldo/keto reductase n=1 Tax=Nostoc sp. TaxID=1180 RepID=UPI002FFC7C37
MQKRKGRNGKHGPALPGRRQVLGAGIALAATSLLPRNIARALDQNTPGANTPPQSTPGNRRRLGTLEVSAVGLGVQNMSRTYQQTIPTRSEMFNIIRTAFDRGVTFYDAAEAYGPHEVERILGEGVAPFRDRVAIATKFGWNIDLEIGERRPGLNSRPEHIKRVVEGMLKRLRTDRIDLLYQHRVDPQIPIEDVAGAARVSPLPPATEPSRLGGASVTFEAGARTAWHTHPLGQTLIVTSGVGRVQRWGGPIEEMRTGDVVQIPPGVKHWHGAATAR